MNKETLKAALTTLKLLRLGNSNKFDCSRLTVALVFMLVGLVLGGIISYGLFGCGTTIAVTERDTTTYVDTIPYHHPVPKDSMVIKYVTRTLPKSGNNSVENIPQIGNIQGDNIPVFAEVADSDSATVAIPITQKRYEGNDYRAWVSGFEPSLDSIYVFPTTTVIHERSYKPPNRWHLGITGGFGYGFKSKHAEPYIGIGITYSLISF